MSDKIEFDDVEDLQRKPEIEGKIGTVAYFPGERWIRLLAATDANPRWMARRKSYAEGLQRLIAAEASGKRVREFQVPFFAECFMIEWGGWKSRGVEIPLTPEAACALLRRADDVHAVIDQTVFDTKKFRGAKIEVVVEEGKGSSTGSAGSDT